METLNALAATCAPAGAERAFHGASVLSTGCPNSAWREVAARALPRSPPVTFVNIGANKGYALLEFMQLWSQHHVSGRHWQERIKAFGRTIPGSSGKGLRGRWSCGTCNDCARPLPAPHTRSSGRAHALELAESNRQLLRHLLLETGLASSVTVYDLAASNVTVETRIPKVRPGDERGALWKNTDCQSSVRSVGDVASSSRALGWPNFFFSNSSRDASSSCDTVQTTTVDDWASSVGLSAIYELMIDVEGSDALVVEGARQLLQRRAISVLSFEVNARGYWAVHPKAKLFRERRTLRRLTQWLADFGYECFFEFGDVLLPITRDCWRESYDARRKWSNVACAHEPSLLSLMHNHTFSGRSAKATIESHGEKA